MRPTAPSTSARARSRACTCARPTPKIVEALRESGRLFRAGEYEHAYPHCWRCDTPLIYYAKTSWYVRTTEVQDELLAANETIDWYPEHIKHGRFGKWLENNVDWALSRERYWGTPLPIWRCGDGDHVVCVGSLAEIAERGGEPPEDVHRPFIDEVVLTCEDCGGEMRRVPDLIDVWWDSGCMPFAQWHAPFENQDSVRGERFPADYICEALDQTRGWFYSLLAVSVLLFGRAVVRDLPLPRPDPRPRGPEDVEVEGQRRGALGRARRPTARTPSAGTTSPRSSPGTATASRSRPSASRCASSSSRSGTRTRSTSSTRT